MGHDLALNRTDARMVAAIAAICKMIGTELIIKGGWQFAWLIETHTLEHLRTHPFLSSKMKLLSWSGRWEFNNDNY
jgi:hypothetical protein